MRDRMTYFQDTLQADQRAIIDFIVSQQFGVVAEVAQEPAQFPHRSGGAVEAAGDQASGQMLGLKAQRNRSGNTVSARASDTARDQPGRGTDHPGRSRWRSDRRDGDSRSSASCCTLFRRQITVELAKQGVAVFLGPVSKVSDKVFDLLTRSFAQDFDTAKISGI